MKNVNLSHSIHTVILLGLLAPIVALSNQEIGSKNRPATITILNSIKEKTKPSHLKVLKKWLTGKPLTTEEKKSLRKIKSTVRQSHIPEMTILLAFIGSSAALYKLLSFDISQWWKHKPEDDNSFGKDSTNKDNKSNSNQDLSLNTTNLKEDTATDNLSKNVENEEEITSEDSKDTPNQSSSETSKQKINYKNNPPSAPTNPNQNRPLPKIPTSEKENDNSTKNKQNPQILFTASELEEKKKKLTRLKEKNTKQTDGKNNPAPFNTNMISDNKTSDTEEDNEENNSDFDPENFAQGTQPEDFACDNGMAPTPTNISPTQKTDKNNQESTNTTKQKKVQNYKRLNKKERNKLQILTQPEDKKRANLNDSIRAPLSQRKESIEQKKGAPPSGKTPRRRNSLRSLFVTQENNNKESSEEGGTSQSDSSDFDFD